MTEADKALAQALRGGDNLELIPGGTPSVNSGIGASISPIIGNLPFKAELTFNISVRYFSQAVPGTPVVVAAAAIPAAQKVPLPLYMFAQGDLQSNYARIKQQLPSSGWDISKMAIIVGGNKAACTIKPLSFAPYALGSIINSNVSDGDILLAFPMVGFVAGAAATTVIAEVLIHGTNVAYKTLVDALSSDQIVLNMIRYTVDTTQTAQLQNQLLIGYQTALGKATFDTLDPNTYVTGGTYNRNISDIPIGMKLDKNLLLGTYVHYDSLGFSWTVMIAAVQKAYNSAK